MKLVGQPDTYSDVLERVFVTSVITGFVCTGALAAASPDVKRVLSSINVEADLGPIKNLKLLCLAVPLLVGFISRISKLHDRISDLFRLRYWIDTRYVLLNLAQKTDVALDDTRRALLKTHRRQAMYRVFYPFVSLPDSKIDKQTIRSVLDNLGWFWVIVESSVIVLLTSLIMFVLGSPSGGYVSLMVLAAMLLLALLLWFACKRTTQAEVEAICSDPQRVTEIRSYLESL